VWYDEDDEEMVASLHPSLQSKGIDYRVRYIYKHQHPLDCSIQKYFTSGFIDSSIINAIHQAPGRGLWGALASDRVRHRVMMSLTTVVVVVVVMMVVVIGEDVQEKKFSGSSISRSILG